MKARIWNTELIQVKRYWKRNFFDPMIIQWDVERELFIDEWFIIYWFTLCFTPQENESSKLADPICTFLFSVLVLITTITILRDTLVVVMEGTVYCLWKTFSFIKYIFDLGTNCAIFLLQVSLGISPLTLSKRIW